MQITINIITYENKLKIIQIKQGTEKRDRTV